MASTLQFLQENGLTGYEALAERTAEAVAVKANVDHLLRQPVGRENKAQER